MFNWEGLLLKTAVAYVESLYQHLTERFEGNQQICNVQLPMSALSDRDLTR
jgi:hypothetical protein